MLRVWLTLRPYRPLLVSTALGVVFAGCSAHTEDYDDGEAVAGGGGCAALEVDCGGGKPCCDVPCTHNGLPCLESFECCSFVCTDNICGVYPCTLDGFPCSSASECCSDQCENGICGPGTCLPAGSACVHSEQCCVGLTCNGGHCGMPPTDSGPCSLDPGGTPCSQCIVGNCCSETETCLDDFACAPGMANFQECAITGTPPDQCQQMSCDGNANCTSWAQCVINSCIATCF
jgi:hypothetical protein